MEMDNRLVVLFVFAVVASLLLLAGCKGEIGGKANNAADLTTPPPLPEETADEGGDELPPAPPAVPSEGQEPGLPLLG